MDTGEEKRALRRAAKAAVALLSDRRRAEAAVRVMAAVRRDPDFIAAGHVLAFWPLPDEIDLRPLITGALPGKRFYLPAVSGDDLLVKPYDGRLEQGAFHIMEPGTPAVDPGRIDYVIVPGVCFDASGRRLGRGRGYYDRFLPATRAVKAGVCYAAQCVERVPVDAFDIRVDKVFFG